MEMGRAKEMTPANWNTKQKFHLCTTKQQLWAKATATTTTIAIAIAVTAQQRKQATYRNETFSVSFRTLKVCSANALAGRQAGRRTRWSLSVLDTFRFTYTALFTSLTATRTCSKRARRRQRQRVMGMGKGEGGRSSSSDTLCTLFADVRLSCCCCCLCNRCCCCCCCDADTVSFI